MLKRSLSRFLLLLVLGCSSAQAGPINIDLQSVPLAELIRLVFHDVIAEDYVMDGSILADSSTFTLRLSNKTPDQIRRFVFDFLDAHGYAVIHRDGLNIIVKKPEQKADEKGIYIYRPLFRDASELLAQVSSLFPEVHFSGVAGLPPVSPVHPPQPAGQPAPPAPSPSRGTPSPTSALALTSRFNQYLVYAATERDHAAIERLLSDIDAREAEVVIHAHIYEVTLTNTDSSAFGLLLNALGSRLNLRLDASSFSNSLAISTSTLSVVLSYLDTDARFRVLSSPFLRVRNGESATLTVGSDVPVLDSVSFASNGNPVQSVSYKSSGDILEITPSIHSNVVDLHVSQQLSNFVQTLNGVNNSPTLIKRSLITDLSVIPGSSVVIGGLHEVKRESSSSGVSFLPEWLHSKSSDASDSEILILLSLELVGRESDPRGEGRSFLAAGAVPLRLDTGLAGGGLKP